MIRNSSVFSSGSEYEWFCEQYCDRCRHYKEREDGFPALVKDGGCPVRDKLEYARFGQLFPYDCLADLATPDGEVIAFNVCRLFWAKTEEDQFAYFRMFKDAICGKGKDKNDKC